MADPAFSDLAWDEAIEAFRARGILDEDELSTLIRDHRARGETARKLLLETVQKNTRAAIERALQEGTNFADFRKDVRATVIEPLGLTEAQPWYLDTVMRTNVQTAYSEARTAAQTAPEVLDAYPYWRKLVVGDGRTRSTHAALAGYVFRHGNPKTDVLRGTLGFNCFPGDTLVQGVFDTAIRARYSGEIVQLTTESGRRLSVTPNHPLATPEGFAFAASIHEGQYVLGYDSRNHDAAARDVDPQDAPSRIEDVFDALAVRNGAAAALRVVPQDFHGDAAFFQGDVDIVSTDRELLGRMQSERGTDGGQSIFPFAASSGARKVGGGSAHDLGVRAFAPATGDVGGSGLLGAGGGAHGGPFQKLRLGPAASLNASLAKPALDDLAVDSKFIRELLLRNAGAVLADKVVKVGRVSFHGFVYDLQSPFGWIVANDIVTSNCRCADQAVSRDYDGPIQEDVPSGFSFDAGWTR